MRRMIFGVVAVAGVLGLAGCASGRAAAGDSFVQALVSGDTDQAAGMLPTGSPIDVGRLSESMKRMAAVCKLGEAQSVDGVPRAAVVWAQCPAGSVDVTITFDDAGKIANIRSVER